MAYRLHARELVARLASVLWRLRRSTSIETGLMQIQGVNRLPILTPYRRPILTPLSAEIWR